MNAMANGYSVGWYRKPLVSAAIAACLFASRSTAIEYEIFPNPNVGNNTITVLSGDVGTNNADPFENFGAINVVSGGTLRNVGQMDILFQEVGGSLSTVNIGAGGLLETTAGSKMNFDSVSHFNVSGVVTNLGDISADWSIQLAEGSQFTNAVGGIFTNKQGAAFNGTLTNFGTFQNATPGSGAGGYLVQRGDFDNQAAATFLNHGEVLNVATINNHGDISNTVNFNSGVNRGVFRNGGTLNNFADGTVTNRQRWFNTGELNNAGVFDNHPSGIGLENSAGGSINNLAGGVFRNDSALYNSGSIANSGQFYAGAISGDGSYLQTDGETIADGTLHASTVDIAGGSFSGNGAVTGAVSFGSASTLSPGLSVGHLDFTGDVLINGAIIMELAGVGRFDSINVDGILSLGSSSAINIRLLDGFSPDVSMAFDLLIADQIIGDLGAIVLPSGLGWDLRVVKTSSLAGTGGVLRLVAVPEPSSFLLTTFVSAVIIAALRKRRSGPNV
ncbi:hypothetical protein Poly51_51690 [Rubripirellula tenax]|uniref:PEP-CTERM protein-sorting domain-containing protein n=1 Tax=Rubripirellula tenax TaxID=2528015 RepID=A0A5C6EJC8_9BACT|nr:hypothetical protein [Rubripirellula tenax]TWU47369.1 hypothetical protein Poly51_51690 [Rubripirellula tenax]